jgi:hypothetical protein
MIAHQLNDGWKFRAFRFLLLIESLTSIPEIIIRKFKLLFFGSFQPAYNVCSRQDRAGHPIEEVTQVLNWYPARQGGLHERLSMVVPLLPNGIAAVDPLHDVDRKSMDRVGIADVTE